MDFDKHDVCILKVQGLVKRNPKHEGWKRIEMEIIEEEDEDWIGWREKTMIEYWNHDYSLRGSFKD